MLPTFCGSACYRGGSTVSAFIISNEKYGMTTTGNAAETFVVPGHAGNIHVRLWEPMTTPRGVIFFVHGYAEYGGRYEHVATGLRDQGFSVVAADHVGHGHSEGERALIHDFGDVVSDLGEVVSVVQARYPRVPLVMIGHSMGGLITARFIQKWPERLHGAAFLGAVLGDWQWARDVLALPELPEADSDPSGMSRDAAVCADYANDPLVYHGSYKRQLLVAEVAALDQFQMELDRITIPVAVFHGDADPFVPFEPTVEAVKSMPSMDQRIKVYAGARHELVNETNRDEVIDDLHRWIDGLLASLRP